MERGAVARRRIELVRKMIAAIGLGLAIAFSGIGAFKSHEVLALNAEELAELLGTPPAFEVQSDWKLIIDTTFTGVILKDGKLRFTYDHSQPVGKRKCPT
jgi:hypothetical protein